MSGDPKKLLKGEGTAPRLEYMLMVLGIAIVFFMAVNLLSPNNDPRPPASAKQARRL